MNMDQPNTQESRSIGVPPDDPSIDSGSPEWHNRLNRLIQGVNWYCEFIDSDDYYEDALDKYENDVFEAAIHLVKGPEYDKWAKIRWEDM